MPTFSAASLIDFSRQLFQSVRVPAEEADLVARSLVDANLVGHDSHGILRVPQYIQFLQEGKLHSNVPLTVLHETPALLSADAQWGLGQVQAHRLLERILPKARTLGVAVGTLRRCGHIGRLGEYAERAAAEGMALFATVNSHGSGRRVAPPGGIEGRISTNPLCLGAPTPTDPLVLDFGTSACAEGKVRVHYQKGEPVPEGWLLDAHGRPTTDPSVLYHEPRGTILPMGGSQAYKGFGLGFMLDLFAGGLSGGESSRPDRPLPGLGNSVVLILLSIEQLGGREHFLRTAHDLAEFVRSCPRAEGVSSIVLPGDPERNVRRQRQKEGIPIADGTWKLLTDLAQQLGVMPPSPAEV